MFRVYYTLSDRLEHRRVNGDSPGGTAFQFVDDHRDDPIVDIVAAQMGVAVSREDFEDPVLELKYRDVECAAAQIVNGDDGLVLLVDSVCKRRRGWLVHDSQHLEPRQMTRVLGSLPLSVVEISRHSYDSLGDFFAEELRGAPFEITKYECGNLRWREHAVAHFEAYDLFATRRDLKRNEAEVFLYVVAALTHESLHGIDGLSG